MAKVDLGLDRFDLSPAFRRAATPAWIKDKPINGFDTETADGSAFVLSYCFDGKDADAIHRDGDVLDIDEVMSAIRHRDARGSVNVWYNLDFDANVILSGLPTENLFELLITNTTKWKGLQISYIPAKLLCIRDGRNRYDHYDVSQFFFGSLDAAAKEWIGEGKERGSLDLTRFGDRNYRVANFAQILRYAKVDAIRVRDLFRVFAESAEAVGVPCGKPYSTGYLGEQTMNVVFRSPGNAKPGFSFHPMQKVAWESYRGGRFEITERGLVGDAVTIDINSAYPNVLRNLPDPASLRWHLCRPTLEQIREADYGFVQATVTTDARRPIQPFAVKRDGKLLFPALRDVPVTVLKQDFEHAISSGLITDYKIESAWIAWTTPKTRYPFRFLEELYRKRQEFKAQGKDKAQQVLKIVINSIYGKLCQLTETTSLLEDQSETPDYLPLDVLPARLRRWAEEGAVEIKRKTKCGAYFNPFLASHITGLTRLALLETAITNGFESDVLMLATDSLTIRSASFDRSGFAAQCNKELGGWELETRGDCFLVGSGIYEMRQANGTVKARTRGFERGIGAFMVDLSKDGGLRALAEKTDGPIIPITSKRPLKIPQAIYQNFNVSDVGKFFEFPRGIRAGMDTKRNWDRGSDISWKDLLDGAEKSRPKSLDLFGAIS